MNKPRRRRVMKNFALRAELIAKGLIIPMNAVPKHLKARGFEAASVAANERLLRGLPLYVR